MEPVTVLVDAENVRRSTWPNISEDELVERVCEWATDEGVHAVVVFDGPAPDADPSDHCVVVGTRRESADDWIAREAKRLAAAGSPYRLVTSDRGLRDRAGETANEIIGGGTFAKSLLRR